MATDWLNTEETAAELGVVPSTVYRAINDGRLRAYRPARVIWIRRADVDE